MTPFSRTVMYEKASVKSFNLLHFERIEYFEYQVFIFFMDATTIT